MRKPYVVTISSEKGGVGKTTLAINLAVYLKALNEDLPLTLFSFDNHFSVERLFRIGKQGDRGDVSGLFTGRLPEELLELGEYGVQFIPSCRRLDELPEVREAAADRVARSLAASHLGGIVIIDTRPTLDILTRNALCAADLVLIPVKDTPSLENCRNLYDFCQSQGIPKKALRLLPCLIDSRIRFKGPFADAYQLLKAYAINRGYRCMEGFISKSPKVESLNTNPEGRIYPILTHGRGTNVHRQFAHLARQIMLAAKGCETYRVDSIRQQQLRQRDKEHALRQRLENLLPNCLVCDRLLEVPPDGERDFFYGETADGRICGYLEENCFTDLVFRHFYQTRRQVDNDNPLRELFRESSERSYFVLRLNQEETDGSGLQFCFYRFDEQGLEISRKSFELKTFENRFLSREKTRLFRLMERAGLLDNPSTKDFLLIRRMRGLIAGEALPESHYAAFRQVMNEVAARLPKNLPPSSALADLSGTAAVHQP